MNRRNFLRLSFGVATVTALPSEVWPFRKIFLPFFRPATIADPTFAGLEYTELAPLSEAAVLAIEMECFKQHISELVCGETLLYSRFKKDAILIGENYPRFMIVPTRIEQP